MGAWTVADPPEQEPQHFAAPDALSASAREWHKLQLAALAFVGLCGVLTGDNGTRLPMWLQSVAGMLALLALAVAAIGVLLVALVAWPLGAPADPTTGARRLRAGVILTGVAVGLTAFSAVAPTALPVVLTGLGVAGVGVGAMFAVLFAMIGDTVEYEEWRSGIRAESLVYAGPTLGQKMGSALGGMAAGWFLGFAGYLEGDVADQPASALQMIDFLFIWLPLIIAVPMLLVMVFYRLDKQYPQILDDLEKRAV